MEKELSDLMFSPNILPKSARQGAGQQKTRLSVAVKSLLWPIHLSLARPLIPSCSASGPRRENENTKGSHSDGNEHSVRCWVSVGVRQHGKSHLPTTGSASVTSTLSFPMSLPEVLPLNWAY